MLIHSVYSQSAWLCNTNSKHSFIILDIFLQQEASLSVWLGFWSIFYPLSMFGSRIDGHYISTVARNLLSYFMVEVFITKWLKHSTVEYQRARLNCCFQGKFISSWETYSWSWSSLADPVWKKCCTEHGLDMRLELKVLGPQTGNRFLTELVLMPLQLSSSNECIITFECWKPPDSLFQSN